MPGNSRASQRRAKKRARQEEAGDAGPAPVAAVAAPAPPSSALPAAAAAPPLPPPSSGEAAAASEDAPAGAFPEWTIEMPAVGTELYDAVQLALSEAQTIVGRKYRYGALLLAGDDHIPLKSGSNKKPFQRDNIHAEMAVLKGCPRPAGKDMMIARLAPSRSARRCWRHSRISSA